MTLRQGRDLDARDRFGAPLAAVVNQAFVNQAFPGERPLGRHFKLIWSGGRPGEPAEQVGHEGRRHPFALILAPGPDASLLSEPMHRKAIPRRRPHVPPALAPPT